jgi:hypothetical protein
MMPYQKRPSLPPQDVPGALSFTPAGAAVPLILTANFIQGGRQVQLTSTVNVRVVK